MKMAFQELAEKRYRATPYRGDVFVVKSDRAPQDYAYWPEPANGWTSVVQGKLDLLVVNCLHEDLFDPPHVNVVANAIRDYTRRIPKKGLFRSSSD